MMTPSFGLKLMEKQNTLLTIKHFCNSQKHKACEDTHLAQCPCRCRQNPISLPHTTTCALEVFATPSLKNVPRLLLNSKAICFLYTRDPCCIFKPFTYKSFGNMLPWIKDCLMDRRNRQVIYGLVNRDFWVIRIVTRGPPFIIITCLVSLRILNQVAG